MSDLVPYYNFYENVMKTLFHNFKSLYEDLTELENPKMWKEYLSINQLFARKILEVKNKFPILE